MFGKSPSQSINRLAQTDQIISSFSAEVPASQIYMITGVRGSGKTVFMTELSKYFHKKKNWVTVDLNPAADLLQGLAARLYNEQTLTRMFDQAKIDLSRNRPPDFRCKACH